MKTEPAKNRTRNEPLWAAYHRTRSDADRNALVLVYLPQVKAIAENLRSRLAGGVKFVDLVQWGTLGLMEAIRSFDPARKVTFGTFGAQRIRGAMFDGLRSASSRNRSTMDRTKKLLTAESALTVELGRPPTPEETIKRLGIDRRKYRNMIRQRQQHNQSLDQADEEIASGLADPKAIDPIAAAQFNELMDFILANFRLTAALLLKLHYLEGLPLSEVAPFLGRGLSSVLKIHQFTLASLRRQLAA